MHNADLITPALSTSILLDEQLHCRYMTVILVSGSYRQCLCETASRLSVATSTHMLKGLPSIPSASSAVWGSTR